MPRPGNGAIVPQTGIVKRVDGYEPMAIADYGAIGDGRPVAIVGGFASWAG
jgi:hypothetical protein